MRLPCTCTPCASGKRLLTGFISILTPKGYFFQCLFIGDRLIRLRCRLCLCLDGWQELFVQELW